MLSFFWREPSRSAWEPAWGDPCPRPPAFLRPVAGQEIRTACSVLSSGAEHGLGWGAEGAEGDHMEP